MIYFPAEIVFRTINVTRIITSEKRFEVTELRIYVTPKTATGHVTKSGKSSSLYQNVSL